MRNYSSDCKELTVTCDTPECTNTELIRLVGPRAKATAFYVRSVVTDDYVEEVGDYWVDHFDVCAECWERDGDL